MTPAGWTVTAPLLQVHVVGRPITQGSKNAYVRRTAAGVRAVLVEKRGGDLKDWRSNIRAAVLAEIGVHPQPVTGPVSVRMWFALPKPSSAPKRRRTWPTGARSGDADKLVRAVFDALTDSGLWLDDSQVVHHEACKDYPGPDVRQSVPGVIVHVSRVVES